MLREDILCLEDLIINLQSDEILSGAEEDDDSRFSVKEDDGRTSGVEEGIGNEVGGDIAQRSVRSCSGANGVDSKEYDRLDLGCSPRSSHNDDCEA